MSSLRSIESRQSLLMRLSLRGGLLALVLVALVLIPALHHHSIAPAGSGDQLGSGSVLCGLCVSGGDSVALSPIASVSIQPATFAIVAVALLAPGEPPIEGISSRGPPLLLVV
jgi:hypothetical protein